MAPLQPQDLRVAIIGAGMGGLSTALALAKKGFKDISVYEYASDLGFVGAGIQFAPNMARILDRWGVWKDIEREAVDLTSTSIRQGSTDKELAFVDLKYVRSTYTYPHMVGHRSSLAGSIFEGCKQQPAIKFFFGHSITEIKSFGPQPSFLATPRNPSSSEPVPITCDILLAADGVKSPTRDQMLRLQNVSSRTIDTGQAAYRIMIPRSALQHDPELLSLIDHESVTRWIGEKRHIIAYPVSNKQIYNLSTVQPDNNFAAAPSATYTTRGSKPEMMKVFADFCPKVQRMLDLVPDGEVCEWKLRVHERLPFWTLGQTALLGDACHPTLPHLAQGAAQAVEDAAVLGVVLAKMRDVSPEGISRALKVYEKVRMERAYTLVELAAASGRALHLGEGAAKEERDRAFAGVNGGKGGRVPDKWADAEVQRMVYGVDVERVAEEEFEVLYNAL